MQQRQLRLGDTLDDYCPRERRVTNHVIVAMVGDNVKQTRCTTCDADHEYKHAKVPRQRKKTDVAALASQTPAGPKRVIHDVHEDAQAPQTLNELVAEKDLEQERAAESARAEAARPNEDEHDDDVEVEQPVEEGPVHRPLIRATLPRHEGQVPPQRPAPEFTIRQPGGRGNRFRPRNQRGGQPFGNRSNGNGGGQGHSSQGGFGSRRPARHHDRKRSK